MSKYLDKLGLEHYHDLVKSGLYEYIEGTQGSATSTWTGVSTQPELFEGKLIIYHLPYSGGSAVPTLNLTLPDNTTTGAKTVGTRAGTSYSAGSNIILVYTGTAWDVVEAEFTDLTANRAVVSDSNGKLSESNVTATELGYLSGVTSSIQNQLTHALDPIIDCYWWKKYEYNGEDTSANFTSMGYSGNKISGSTNYAYLSPISGTQTVVKYGDSLFVDPYTGNVSIYNPTTMTINSSSAVTTLRNKYFQCTTVGTNVTLFSKDKTYKGGSNMSANTSVASTMYSVTFSTVFEITSASSTISFIEYLYSANNNAYPSGLSDGYYYEPIDKRLDIIKAGSYIGTGTRPNTLDIGIVPKILFIFAPYNATFPAYGLGMVIDFLHGRGFTPVDGVNTGYVESVDGTTVKITTQNTSTGSQNYCFNNSSTTYYWLAIM